MKSFSFIPQLFCEKNIEYLKPKLDSGKEWKPDKEKDSGKPVAFDPGRMTLTVKQPKVIVHPVVGDHLKMGDDANLDQGPGERKTTIRKTTIRKETGQSQKLSV